MCRSVTRAIAKATVIAKPVTLENVADALYIVAQLAANCGDYGTLPENPDLRERFEAEAGALMFSAGDTNFCADFIAIVDRDLGDVGYPATS